MAQSFFPTRALFWSFWANIVFIFGMIGYFLMDGLDYMRPNAINSSLTSIIYVILAATFVIDASLQLSSIYNINSNTHRYYAMVFSCIFDEVGSHAYLLGALCAATAFASSNTIWIFNTVGVCGFVVAAIINMMVTGSSVLYSWANNLNLLGSLLYLLAILIDRIPLTLFIVIAGNLVYLIDAVLYTISWFSDRQLGLVQGENLILLNK
jgi:hypothetical protein